MTAKISWLSGGGAGQGSQFSTEGKPRWIHCTPLLGSDDKVGVWMIVMVENEEVTGTLNARGSVSEAPGNQAGAASSRFTGNKLYTEYMRREGRDVMSPLSSPRTAATDLSLPSRHGSERSGQGQRTYKGAETHPFHDF